MATRLAACIFFLPLAVSQEEAAAPVSGLNSGSTVPRYYASGAERRGEAAPAVELASDMT